MNKQTYLNTLLAPLFSEKSNNVSQNGQYVFRVNVDSTKTEIKNAVQQLFSVEVSGVNVVNVNGKTKRRGRIMGRRKSWKKAYVMLKAGHSIDVSGASA